MIKKIESSENQFIKKINSLKNKKYRDQESLYITEGLTISEDLLLNSEMNKNVENIILSENNEHLIFKEPFSLFIDKTIIISERLAKDLGDTITTQGVFLVVRKTEINLQEKISDYNRVLILDCISDPGNMGTLIRTALAAKFDAIIALKGSVDIYNPKVVRSTMGAINKIDIIDNIDFKEVFPVFKDAGFKVFFADLDGEKTIYSTFPEDKIALVMGSESKGISLPEEYSDIKVTIPMNEQSESLNVSVAGGLLMYAINRSKFEK